MSACLFMGPYYSVTVCQSTPLDQSDMGKGGFLLPGGKFLLSEPPATANLSRDECGHGENCVALLSNSPANHCKEQQLKNLTVVARTTDIVGETYTVLASLFATLLS